MRRYRSNANRWWLNLPIRYKGLMVVALPVVALTATLVMRMPFNRQQHETTALLERASDTRDVAQELAIALLEVETGVRGYVLTGERAFLARFENARESVPQRLHALAAMLTSDDERKIYAQVAALTRRELALATELSDLVERGAMAGDPAVQSGFEEEKRSMDALHIALGTLQHNHDALVADSQAELARLRMLLTPVLLITWVGGTVGTLAAGWLFVTGISERVRALEQNAERLARGERLQFASSRGSDEIGSLDRALRRASLLLRTHDRRLRAVNMQLEHTVHEQMLLNRELEAFSYSVSHDLRAPLRSIDGFAQALREDWGDRLDQTGQDHLSRVRNAAQRMGRLIDDLLKLSRLTRAQIQRLDVDLSRLASDIAADLDERNPERKVTWAIGEGLHAWCDPSLARIVLENLLGNAWKFTSKTPEPRIDFYAMPDTNPSLFVVRDNGAGFDMKYIDKLFAPFQRLHAEREFPGTGIGLATVQRIVHKHGGEVRTRAGVGEGATFYFTLEPADGAAAA